MRNVCSIHLVAVWLINTWTGIIHWGDSERWRRSGDAEQMNEWMSSVRCREEDIREGRNKQKNEATKHVNGIDPDAHCVAGGVDGGTGTMLSTHLVAIK